MAYPPAVPIHGTLTNASPANTGGSGAEHVDYHNDAATAITDIVTELGDDPAGTDADVTARLTRLEALNGLRAVDYGLISYNQPPWTWSLNATALTDGTLYLMKLWVPVSTITSIMVRVNGGGSGMSTAKAGLYSMAGAKLAETADVDSQLGSAGQPELVLTAPYAVTVPTLLRVGIYVDGTTPPSLGRSGANGAVNAGLAAATAPWVTADTGLTTTLPSTLGALTLSSTAFGAAVL